MLNSKLVLHTSCKVMVWGGGWEKEYLDNFKSSESIILEKSEDRWKIICSIAQGSGDSPKGKSSSQHTSHYTFLFLNITRQIIMAEVIIDNNNNHCYYNSYRYASDPAKTVFCTHNEKRRKTSRSFYSRILKNSIKMTIINYALLLRAG